jgi:hypothetical protein
MEAKEENRNFPAFIPPESTCVPNPSLPLLTYVPVKATINSESAARLSRLLMPTLRLSFYR